jgi:hypothetical protein
MFLEQDGAEHSLFRINILWRNNSGSVAICDKGWLLHGQSTYNEWWGKKRALRCLVITDFPCVDEQAQVRKNRKIPAGCQWAALNRDE